MNNLNDSFCYYHPGSVSPTSLMSTPSRPKPVHIAEASLHTEMLTLIAENERLEFELHGCRQERRALLKQVEHLSEENQGLKESLEKTKDVLGEITGLPVLSYTQIQESLFHLQVRYQKALRKTASMKKIVKNVQHNPEEILVYELKKRLVHKDLVIQQLRTQIQELRTSLCQNRENTHEHTPAINDFSEGTSELFLLSRTYQEQKIKDRTLQNTNTI